MQCLSKVIDIQLKHLQTSSVEQTKGGHTTNITPLSEPFNGK